MELNFTTLNEAGQSSELAEQFGLTLCPRCARAFTSGELCGKCEEIAAITLKRIHAGITNRARERARYKFIAIAVVVAFWTACGFLVWWSVR